MFLIVSLEQNEEEEEEKKQTPSDDPLIATKNSLGRVARLGQSGKFYCGGKTGFSCGCCDGNCGPSNGCNCVACMKLDIQKRGLPKGYLVNNQGFACRRGDTRKFYCGRMVLRGVRGCDGYCGPTDGPQCDDCKNMDTLAARSYSTLI